MGCVLGTFSFNLTAYVRVYRTLLVTFADFVQRALTDDLSQFGKPEGAGSHEQWLALYDHLADYLEAYDRLANPIGLFRHETKGKLLLPPAAPTLHLARASSNTPRPCAPAPSSLGPTLAVLRTSRGRHLPRCLP